ARIVERADPDGDEVGPGRYPQKQHGPAIRAERAGNRITAVRRSDIELGLALGYAEAYRWHPPAGGKGAAALALAIAAVTQQCKAGFTRRFIADCPAQAAARHNRHDAMPRGRTAGSGCRRLLRGAEFRVIGIVDEGLVALG